MSAVPRGLPPTQFKRVSIKQKSKKAMRHGKFSKFLDFLLEIKNDAQNTGANELMSIVQDSADYTESNASERRMGQRANSTGVGCIFHKFILY
jgi:hypothetical protein